MRKRIIALILCLVIVCLILAGCVNGENTGENTENAGNTSADQTAQLPEGIQVKEADGMYEWNMRGVTLRTRSNVANYIHGKVWDFKRFLKTLGWSDRYEGEIINISVANIYGFSSPKRALVVFENTTVSFNLGPIYDHDLNKLVGYFCHGIYYTFNGQAVQMYGVDMKDVPLNRNAPFEYYIMDKADNITIPFELIVCFHYICEQLAENPDVDPLEGTIPKDPNYSNLYSL